MANPLEHPPTPARPQEYIEAYCKHFKLDRHIMFGVKVRVCFVRVCMCVCVYVGVFHGTLPGGWCTAGGACCVWRCIGWRGGGRCVWNTV